MKKICNECNTENELHYLYCKNCGNPLEGEKTVNPPLNEEPKTQAPPVAPAPAVPNSVEDIDKQDFTEFIGKNSDKIFSKFVRMEYSHSKVSWCWPAAILQLLFGFLGGAIWFFYRKMYKVAVILVAIGIVFTAAQTALTFNTQVSVGNYIVDSFSQIFEEIESGFTYSGASTQRVIENIEKAPTGKLDMLLVGIADVLDLIETYAGAALVGMFAMHLYKKHCIKKIRAYKQGAVNPQYYSYCLGLIGGTSGGMLALGIIITAIVTSAADGVTAIAVLSSLGG